MQIKDDMEEVNIKQRTIVLDTSSMNQLLKNKDLLTPFFDKVKNLNAIVVIPLTALSEISINNEIFNDFKNIYLKKDLLKIICEGPRQMMRREIDMPIEFYLFFRKNMDSTNIFSNIDKSIIEKEKQNHKKMKKAWKKNCQEKSKKFSKDFSLTPKERNKQIEEKLKTSEFLKNYINKKDYWVLDWFKQEINIDFPKIEIYSNINRYKYINLLQYLMHTNMLKSLISGKSEFSSRQGDLFDMVIASYSAFSYCFISEDEGQVRSLQIIKDTSEEIGFENKCKIYHKIEDFIR